MIKEARELHGVPYVHVGRNVFQLFKKHSESWAKFSTCFSFILNQNYTSKRQYKPIKRRHFESVTCVEKRWITEKFNAVCGKYSFEDIEYSYTINNLIEIKSTGSNNLYRPNWDFIEFIIRLNSEGKRVYFNKVGQLCYVESEKEQIVTREKEEKV